MGRSIFVSVKTLSITMLVSALLWPWTNNLAQAQSNFGQSNFGQSKIGSNPIAHPGDVEYVGLTKCAACHFDQYKDWKGSQHNKAFEILPAKYRNDASCLQCHTTGAANDVSTHQFGVSCEACHGPGEEHAKFALRFVNEIITEEGLTILRSKIKRLDLHQCVNCHVSKAHKKHPPYDREAVLPRPTQKGSVSFFQNIHEETPEADSPLDLKLKARIDRVPTEADQSAVAGEIIRDVASVNRELRR